MLSGLRAAPPDLSSALGSAATVHLCNVYGLSPRAFGTFDLVLFFGVLYHLRNPLLALDRVLVCAGSLLLQTVTQEVPGAADIPLARFQPSGMTSGRPEAPRHDPTVFWLPNAECARR